MESEFSDRRFCYVCEGKSDEDRLKKLGCLFVVKTGGKYIRKEIVNYLKQVKKIREIVLVLDPDGPGKKIQERLESELGPCLKVEVETKLAKKNGKVGIAEMKNEDLIQALRPYIHHDLFVDENLSLEREDIFDLNLTGANSHANKEKLVKEYSLPYLSGKMIYDYLLILGKTKDDIAEVLL